MGGDRQRAGGGSTLSQGRAARRLTPKTPAAPLGESGRPGLGQSCKKEARPTASDTHTRDEAGAAAAHRLRASSSHSHGAQGAGGREEDSGGAARTSRGSGWGSRAAFRVRLLGTRLHLRRRVCLALRSEAMMGAR